MKTLLLAIALTLGVGNTALHIAQHRVNVGQSKLNEDIVETIGFASTRLDLTENNVVDTIGVIERHSLVHDGLNSNIAQLTKIVAAHTSALTSIAKLYGFTTQHQP